MKFPAWLKRSLTCADCGSWDISLLGHCHPCMIREFEAAAKGGKAETRTRLPDRRQAVRTRMEWADSHGNKHVSEVSFGFDKAGAIREVFCTAAKDGTDLQALVHDACIATSHALQRGARIADMAKSFGENRPESADSGPPASPLGALARMGAALEAELRGAN